MRNLHTAKRITQFGSEVYKIFKTKIFLNMISETDKENKSCDDIAFLSEIISYFRFWQDNRSSNNPKNISHTN